MDLLEDDDKGRDTQQGVEDYWRSQECWKNLETNGAFSVKGGGALTEWVRASNLGSDTQR